MKNLEQLLKTSKSVTVVFPPFKSRIASQNRENEETKTFEVSEANDYGNGKLDFDTLLSNLLLWSSRNYKITFNK